MKMRWRANIVVVCGAAMAVVLCAAACFGQSVLDQQLGGGGQKPADVKKPEDQPKTDAAPKPDDQRATDNKPVAPDMVSPSAAKAVDDMDLVNKLTGADNDKQSPDDKMKEMVDRMGQSQSRLSNDKDPGAITQETQKRIITDLDVMIEYARKQQQSGKSNSDSKQQPGEKRQTSSGQQQGPHQEGGNQAATDSSLPRGPISSAQSNGEDMHQKGPQEWGGLPPRDRDLISNGANEQYLPSYKEMIDRYYQALAEIGKTKER
jgi:hypothetical protein